MIFPYMSMYAHLLRRNNSSNPYGYTAWSDQWDPIDEDEEEENRRSKPWDVGYDGAVDKDSRRRALGAGLTALGTNLLATAAEPGGLAKGFARGAAGFSEAMMAERDRSRREAMEAAEERRRQTEEERAIERESDRNRAAEQDYERGNAELSAWKEQQERGKQQRMRTGKSADQMVADIERLAAENPQDQKLQVMARRAAGYALGEDSDLNKLAGLHEDITNQVFRDEDFDWKREAERRADKADIAAGVASDPEAAERRAEQSLGISAEHLRLSKERAAREKLTPYQMYTQLEKKVKDKLDAKTAQWINSHNGDLPPKQVVDAWRVQALTEASAEIEAGLSTVYRYNQNGTLDPVE